MGFRDRLSHLKDRIKGHAKDLTRPSSSTSIRTQEPPTSQNINAASNTDVSPHPHNNVALLAGDSPVKSSMDVGIPSGDNPITHTDDSSIQSSIVAEWEKAFEIAKKELSEEEYKWLEEARDENQSSSSNVAEELRQKLKKTGVQKPDEDGRKISIKDRIHKILRSIDKYANIVDVAVQHSPEISALVWAGMRLMLQIALNQFEAIERLEEAMSIIMINMAYAQFFASIYEGALEVTLQTNKATASFKKEAQIAMPRFYAAVLIFSVKAKAYIQPTKTDKIKNLLRPISVGLQLYISSIEDGRKKLEDLASAATMERTKASSGNIEKIETLFAELKKAESNREGRLYLAELNAYVAKGASFDSKLWETKDRCLHGTREDLLDEIFEWSRTSDAKCIYWLTGMAGTGKSTIALTAAGIFQKERRLGGSFFFSRGQGDLSKATKLFTTLCAMLLSQIPELLPSVRKTIEGDPRIFDKGLDQQWHLLILQPLQELETPSHEKSPVILVIDALDECENDEDAILVLSALSKLRSIHSVQIRVLITSRPERHIGSGFRSFLESEHHCIALHEIERQKVDSDIRAFLTMKMEKIRRENDFALGWPGDGRIQLLCDRSGGLFIYAATVCRLLRESSCIVGYEEALTDILTNYEVLDELYVGVLEHAMRSLNAPGLKNQKNKYTERVKKILGSIVLLSSPLPAISLAKLIDLPQDSLQGMVHSLRSILDVPRVDDTCNNSTGIRLLHPSFRDFFTKKERYNEMFWVDECQTHQDLFLRCIDVMSKGLKEDICDLRLPGTLATEVSKHVLEQALPAEVRYACRYWIDHLQKIGPLEERGPALCDNLNDKLHSFLEGKFLHWVEALSLLDILPEGVRALKALQSILARMPNQKSQLFDSIRNAERFILKNKWIIENIPLQIYSSALLFSPRCFTYGSLPPWLKSIAPPSEVEWDPLLLSLEHGSKVYAIAYSPDGKLIASGCSDRTIRLWDVATGALTATFEGHSHSVRSVAFSPDGKLITSGSHDNTAWLWDVVTGASTATLEGHSGEVYSVAFSPDGKHIVSGSFDKTVRLWDVATGASTTFKGDSDYVNSVAFSPDGKIIASGSYDCKVRLWDVATGALTATFEGHSDYVRSVAFSPDGKHIASGSDDKTVRLWDVATRTSTAFEGHSNTVVSVAFSPDGKHIASGSIDNTVRLWDVVTTTLTALDCHSRTVSSVAFSPDGKLIASGSYDNTARLWDVVTGASIATFEGHSGDVNSVAFSPDGKIIASGSDDCKVRLWDVITGVSIATFEGHHQLVICVAFSPDGKHIASGSYDKTVRLWDVVTGASVATFEDSEFVSNIAFSPDGKTIASSSKDDTVRLWNMITGISIATFEGHSSWVFNVAFSPDGKLIASGSHDNTVRLWDVAMKMLVHTFEMSSVITRLSFYKNGQFLKTNCGIFKIGPDAKPEDLDCAVSTPLEWNFVGDQWIEYGEHKVLWLPLDFRGAELDIYDDTIVFGLRNGRVRIVQLDPKLLPPLRL